MKNSDQIFDLIEKAAGNPGRLFKEQVVAEIVADELGKRVLVAALDPFTTYGIAKVPERHTFDDGRPFGTDTFELLEALRIRQLTGNDAREAVRDHLDALTPKSAELLKRIITKDLRAGFTDGTVNKAAKGTIKEFPYMRCSLPKDAKLDSFDWAKGVYSQEKADGMFANVDVEDKSNGGVRITSRQGQPFPLTSDAMTALANQLLDTFAERTQTHGELLVYNGETGLLPREQGNGMLNSLSQGGELPPGHFIAFEAWDQIPLDAVKPKGKWDVPYATRWLLLQAQVHAARRLAVRTIQTRIVHSLAEAYEHYRVLLAQGREGTIIKNRHAIWRDGTSKEQVKLKLEVDVDLKPVRFLPGTGKNADTFGAIECETSDGKLVVAVGSGFTDKQRKEIHLRRDDALRAIAVVRANSVMKPSESNDRHSLFLPRMVELRYDKTEADSLERVIDQFESAIKVAA